MKSNRHAHRAAYVAAIVAALGSYADDAQATILGFDQQLVLGAVVATTDASDLPPGYGDRVARATQAVMGGTYTYGEAGEGYTPNILVDFVSLNPLGLNDTSLWSTQYGDLSNVLLGEESSGTLDIRLSADPGYSALLYGFDLAGWPDTDYTITAVRVLDGGTALFTQSAVLVEGDFSGPRHTVFAFATPLVANELLLQIDYGNLAARRQDNIGIDNIRFGQFPAAPVPELPSVLLLGLGLAALAFGRTSVAHNAGIRIAHTVIERSERRRPCPRDHGRQRPSRSRRIRHAARARPE